MKKILLGAMIASVALAASAAEVTSDNVVGYTRLTIEPGVFSIVGTQFFSVGNTSTVDVQDLFKAGPVDGDTIQFFNGGSYELYSFSSVTYDETWSKDLGPGWNDSIYGTRAVRDVVPGEAFWLNSQSTSVTLAGQAETSAKITVPCNGAFTLVSLPVPIEVDIQDIKFVGIIDGDTIQFMRNGQYEMFSYSSVTYDETWSKDLGPGWNDSIYGTRATSTVNMAEGFWLMSSAAEVTISLE